MKKQYVYFFRQIGSNAVKVGLTTDVNRRFCVFSTYAPFGSINMGFIETNNHKLLEKDIHSHFIKFKIKGEWFNLSDEDVKIIIQKYKGTLLIDFKIDDYGFGLNKTKKDKTIMLLRLGYKQNEIAKKLNTPKSYVSKIKKAYLLSFSYTKH